MINKILLYFLVAAATIFGAQAQSTLKLSDIKRIKLVERGGGLSNDFKSFELVLETGVWKSYQTRLRGVTKKLEWIDDSVKTFKKVIASSVLDNLIRIVNARDTSVHKEFFDLSASSLTNALDSLYPGMSKSIREATIKGFRSDKTVSKALYKVLHPRLWDDRTEYDIKIDYADRKSVNLQALSFAAVYDLPWVVDGSKLYDPNISLIFNSLIGNDKYPSYQRLHVKDEVIREIHYEIFHEMLPVRGLRYFSPGTHR